MQEIQESATAVANEQYLNPESDFNTHRVEDADDDDIYLNESLKAIGVPEHDHEILIDHLQDFTTIEVRQGENGTGNFDETNVAYYEYIGEITDSPEWSHDFDTFAWKMAVEKVQGIQESLLGDQLFGICENGEVHYDFEAYTCLVWNKAELVRKGYLPLEDSPEIDRLIDATYQAQQALMNHACYLRNAGLQHKVNAIDNALLGVSCYLEDNHNEHRVLALIPKEAVIAKFDPMKEDDIQDINFYDRQNNGAGCLYGRSTEVETFDLVMDYIQENWIAFKDGYRKQV